VGVPTEERKGINHYAYFRQHCVQDRVAMATKKVGSLKEGPKIQARIDRSNENEWRENRTKKQGGGNQLSEQTSMSLWTGGGRRISLNAKKGVNKIDRRPTNVKIGN